ncbi:hypothetical protein ACFWUW_27715 [Streptomyces sp. NPDC058655]|uniref:hypothetical protein n=1 Tax=Streptomyces sp. NPDC058655 TaxID=3346577 RepID=UPI00365F1C37
MLHLAAGAKVLLKARLQLEHWVLAFKAASKELTEEAKKDPANTGAREKTRETYDFWFKAFANWCATPRPAPGPPTTEANLVSYVSYVRRAEIGFDTLRLTIAAVVKMNARAGRGERPSTVKALKVYTDARHEQREAGWARGPHPRRTWPA